MKSRSHMNTNWTIRGSRQFEAAPFLLFGIVNATPDSFYDGGEHYSETGGKAVKQALALRDQGAAVLDIGGESTRPGALPVPLAEECSRVLPVIEGLRRALAEEASSFADSRAAETDGDCAMRKASAPLTAISVDTYKAETAARALECGADIVNDISACAFEPALVDVLVQYQPGYVLMHGKGAPETMQNAPRYEDVTAEVEAFFEEKLNMLVRAGLREERIMLDPGIGFGKNLEHNLQLLGDLPRFAKFGRPLLMALSNKSMFGHLLGQSVSERGCATAVATALAFNAGVWAHRVHDARAAYDALSLAQAIRAHAS